MHLKAITHVCLLMVRLGLVSRILLLVMERILELCPWFVKRCSNELIKRVRRTLKMSGMRFIYQCLRSTMSVFKIFLFILQNVPKEVFKFERVNLTEYTQKGYAIFL